MSAAPPQRIIMPRAVDKNGECIAGTDRPKSLASLARFAEALPLDRGWQFEISEYRRKRTHEQNAYLWGVVYATLERETGQEAEDWHEFWLGECFGWITTELFGRKKLKAKRRSSRMSTVEFGEYTDFIIRRCAERCIYIPPPNVLLGKVAWSF